LIGLASTLSDGATAWMTPNWAGPMDIAASRMTAARVKSRLRDFEQGDGWSFCLMAGTLCPANQEKS